MSLKKLEQVKADKGFKIFDFIVYGAVVALVVVLFIVIFAVRDTNPIQGVRFKYVNEIIYEYDFEHGEISRNEKYVEITSETDEKIILRVSFSDGDYNVVEIRKSGSVRITDANCPRGDCIYGNTFLNSEIKTNSDCIQCLPHNLQILPLDYDIDSGNIII